MELKDYQEKAQRTCASLGDVRLDLSHMVLGIVSEQEEYISALLVDDEVNQREELADMCWYVANYATFRGYDFEELLSKTEEWEEEFVGWKDEFSPLFLFTSVLSDLVKKFIAYGKEIDRNSEEMALGGILYGISIEEGNFDFKRDLGLNISKLEARYPEKFTNDLANNRNLEAERKILEG